MNREVELENLLDEAIVELVVSRPTGYKAMSVSGLLTVLADTQATNDITAPSYQDMKELITEVFRQNAKTTMLIDHVRDYLALKIHRNGSLYT